MLTTDVGIAELLITARGAFVLTDEIEEGRLRTEELPQGLEIIACRWTEKPAAWDRVVRELSGGGAVASDRPAPGEVSLPQELIAARSSLQPEELARYAALGKAAAEAMTDVLAAAKPEWTEYQLAGAGAEALWGRGIEPALTLAAGERRLPIYRHPTPSAEKLRGRAMLVFCGRRHGLFANLTRFVEFRAGRGEPGARTELDHEVAEVEADALDALHEGVELGAIYDVLVRAYARVGQAGQERAHHQGGTCGYGSRDVIAVPGSKVRIARNNAVAFNPSLPGAKIEDTFVVAPEGLQLLTVDPRWPSREVRGRRRPDVLRR
ncbi:MAG TPA: M24 family metallopeptidase [Myxococcales bacterium]